MTTFRDLTLTRQTLWVNSVINHGLFETTLARAPQTAPSDQAFHFAEAGHHAPLGSRTGRAWLRRLVPVSSLRRAYDGSSFVPRTISRGRRSLRPDAFGGVALSNTCVSRGSVN